MAKINVPGDFRDFLKLLNEHRVEYLLIGGYAVAYHGYPRATADMDIWVANNPTNAERIVQAIREFGFDTPELTTALFLKKDNVIRMGLPPLRIEIWTGISGVEFTSCYAQRIRDKIASVVTDIVDLDSLKRNKKAAGRHKDLEDLANLP